MGVAKAIDKLQATFLWGGTDINKKVHLVKWKGVTKCKSQGGLGVKDLREVNDCLLLKWQWRYGSENNAMWKSVVCSKYGNDVGCWQPSASQTGCSSEYSSGQTHGLITIVSGMNSADTIYQQGRRILLQQMHLRKGRRNGSSIVEGIYQHGKR